MPNTCAHSQTLNKVPKAMPMAARLHSVGRVLMAAGNQRASMMNPVLDSKFEEKKRLVRHIQKALEVFQLLGEERAQCAGQTRC
jgi:hypothetical protein